LQALDHLIMSPRRKRLRHSVLHNPSQILDRFRDEVTLREIFLEVLERKVSTNDAPLYSTTVDSLRLAAEGLRLLCLRLHAVHIRLRARLKEQVVVVVALILDKLRGELAGGTLNLWYLVQKEDFVFIVVRQGVVVLPCLCDPARYCTSVVLVHRATVSCSFTNLV
jgi:hypothetical protein